MSSTATHPAQVSKQQGRWIVKIHIDHVDMTNINKAEFKASDMALKVIDAKFGFHSWTTDTKLSGPFWVTTFTPMSDTGSAWNTFSQEAKENK